MKSKLFFALLLVCSSFAVQAQFADISWFDSSLPGYTATDFGVCGEPELLNFQVAFDFCPNSPSTCTSGCGSNPFRYTVQLFRDGSLIGSQSFVASSDWANTFFTDVYASPGVYNALVHFERRKRFCQGWETLWFGWTSNTIVGNVTPANPDFNVDGNPIPGGGLPMDVCISNIKINAAATTCEKNYFLAVEECNRWWVRTYEYEWGLWFAGEAPDNINLQSRASTYSYPPYYTGDPSRQGDILRGGNLTSGEERYYRVKLCTGDPSWLCKVALIKVNPTCFTTEEWEDTNEYIVWEEESELGFNMEQEISVSYETGDDPIIPFDDITTENLAVTGNTSSKVKIFPNPFSHSTRITLNKEGQQEGTAVLFEVFNNLGEQVKAVYTKDQQFDFYRDELSTGIYFYRVSQDGQQLNSGKIIIQ